MADQEQPEQQEQLQSAAAVGQPEQQEQLQSTAAEGQTIIRYKVDEHWPISGLNIFKIIFGGEEGHCGVKIGNTKFPNNIFTHYQEIDYLNIRYVFLQSIFIFQSIFLKYLI